MDSGKALPERPEVELLLCCARSCRDPQRAAKITVLLQEEIDWEYLLQIAQKHRLLPLLFWQLDTASPHVIPNRILDQLRVHFHNNNFRNLSLTRELLMLLNKFEAHSISAVPYKGPTLANLAYGNLALREFGDLDIMLHRSDVLKARDLLESEGYRPEYRLLRTQEAAFLRYGDQYRYARDDGGSVVELHWGLAARAFSFLLDRERQWWQLERVQLGGGTVPTFSPEDLLLVLCVHGAMHLWERLAWISDVAELVHVRRELNWERLLKQATALGARRTLFLGLLLAHDLLGASIPEKVSWKLHTDPPAKNLAGQVRKWLFQEGTGSQEFFDDTLFQPFHLRVMERPRDKVQYCIRQTTIPSLEDCELLPLPRRLFPAYRLIRPIRLTGKYGRKLLRIMNGSPSLSRIRP